MVIANPVGGAGATGGAVTGIVVGVVVAGVVVAGAVVVGGRLFAPDADVVAIPRLPATTANAAAQRNTRELFMDSSRVLSRLARGTLRS